MAVTTDDDNAAAELRAALLSERQRTLNLTDAVLGAKAAARQAELDTEDLFHRLHVVSTELSRLKQAVGYDEAAPVERIEADLEAAAAAGAPVVERVIDSSTAITARGARKLRRLLRPADGGIG